MLRLSDKKLSMKLNNTQTNMNPASYESEEKIFSKADANGFTSRTQSEADAAYNDPAHSMSQDFSLR